MSSIPFPPVMGQTGQGLNAPPPPPQQAPSLLSAYPGAPPDAGGAGPGQVGALPQLFFQVERMLDTIARAVPAASDELDDVKMKLRDVLANALTGASGKPPSTDEGEMTGPLR